MSKIERIYVAPVMKLALESERSKLAEQIKKQHGLSTITIPATEFSQLLGSNMLNGKKEFRFKIKKTGLNSGILEIVN